MKHPRRIHLSGHSVFTATKSVIEDPYTEPVITLYGRIDEKLDGSVINVRSAYNWTSADRSKNNADVSNGCAEERMIAFEEALRANHPSKNSGKMSRIIGGAHSHNDNEPGKVPLPEPSKQDLFSFSKWMEAYDCPFWVELILLPKLVKDPQSLGVSYTRINGRPVLSVSNKYKGFGIDITFSGHYAYQNSKLRVRELPIDFDPKSVRRYFITE